LEYALEASRYIDSAEDKITAMKVYGELALTYEVLGETGKSVFWYSKSIAERERVGSGGTGVYRTLGLMIKQMVKQKKGAEGIIQLREMRKRNPPTSHQQKAILAQSFAYCYSELKQYKLAESQFIEMIREYKQSRVEQEILYIGYYDISKFYVENYQYSKAELYLSNEILKMTGPSITMSKDVCLLKFKVDSAKGDLLSAIKYYQDYKALNDSAFTEAKSRQINELMIRYESEKKDNNITNLETTATLQNARLLQATQTRNWTLGVALLLFIIISLLMRNSWIKQQTNMKLKAQQQEIRTQNRSLQHLVKEKDWLVKEIHHRVKNNFHTVIGLLGTQSGYLKNAEAISAIEESQQRIQAMSLIHQKLYQSENLSDIHMAAYIHELVDYLKSATNTGKRILFHFQLDPIDLDVYHAIPIGLILNETITNAIKYAFPVNRNGTIHISFTANDDNENNILLVVTDDGIGLPAGFSSARNNTMGMNLMQGLARDIDGHFTIESNRGTSVKIAFTYHRSTLKEQGISFKGTPQTI
uniref:histidine kinase dimerization/phosphoacceptor domain -containing protein n=1 Tax=Mucilaginibacter sp. TaxID=1882438 RepID=UPI0035BBEA82